MINDFRKEYFFLNNFYECPVEYEGLVYQSTEAAFQAAKVVDPEEREIFTHLTPKEAKQRGRRVPLREDWEDIKVQVMEDVCYAKFSQNPKLKERLLATGTQWLEEGNHHGDTFWGTVAGYGKNKLGQCLMEVRRRLSNEEV